MWNNALYSLFLQPYPHSTLPGLYQWKQFHVVEVAIFIAMNFKLNFLLPRFSLCVDSFSIKASRVVYEKIIVYGCWECGILDGLKTGNGIARVMVDVSLIVFNRSISLSVHCI